MTSRSTLAPFLIKKDEDGDFRLTVRDTRYNSQGFPIVTPTLQEERFKTAAAAKLFARETFHAEPSQFATR